MSHPAAPLSSVCLCTVRPCARSGAGVKGRVRDQGRPSKKAPNGAFTIPEAAQALNVGERTVERAIQVKKEAAPEIVAAVKAGDMTVSKAAATIPKKPKDKSPRSARRKATDNSRKKLQAGYWRSLRDAMESINGLPEVDILVKSVPAKSFERISRCIDRLRRQGPIRTC